MRRLTPEQMQELFPGLTQSQARIYAGHFTDALEKAEINTRARACAFVAQLGHESCDLKFLKELWGPTPAQLRYDVRTDLGNTPERDGDGRTYLGRGGLQRTGKKNYRRFQEATGIPVLVHPELLERTEYAFQSDALYWTDNNLNRFADELSLRGDDKDLARFDKITRAINGGYNGRIDRQSRYLVAIASLPAELFADEPPAPPAPPVQTSALDQVAIHVNQPPEPKTPPLGDVLLEKLTRQQGVQMAGKTLAKRIGLRLGGPLGLLYAALEVGNIYAWLGLAVLLLATICAVYHYRVELRSFAKRQLERIAR
jgi:putative chitinase